MRSEEDLSRMLALFDAADESGDLDSEGNGIREALLWMKNAGSTDEDLEQYLPECQHCQSVECSGATGPACDDAEEDDDEEEATSDADE